jgi:hypothetical protein
MFWIIICISSLAIACGLLSVMAGMMSDAPKEADASVNSGFIGMLLGAVALGIDLIAHFNHLL